MLQLVEVDSVQQAEANTKRNAVYASSNWAGAILNAPPAGQTWRGITGTFKVPTPAAPAAASSGTYSASIWTGIDGATHGNAILQAGIDVTVAVAGGKSTPSFSAWYEWYPSDSVVIDPSQFFVKAGDTVNLTITTSDPSKGTIILHNTSSGKSFTQAVNSPSPTNNLAGQNVEWIVEDYLANNELVPFADFGAVNFTGCYAKTHTQLVGTTNAQIINIQDGQTGVDIPGDNEVNIAYQPASPDQPQASESPSPPSSQPTSTAMIASSATPASLSLNVQTKTTQTTVVKEERTTVSPTNVPTNIPTTVPANHFSGAGAQRGWAGGAGHARGEWKGEQGGGWSEHY